jgi:hypothetical protein
MVLQCINGVSSNPVKGRTKIWQLKNLILTLFGLIFRRIYILFLKFVKLYDWLWSGHMIINEMFYIPIKLKPELARASMMTSENVITLLRTVNFNNYVIKPYQCRKTHYWVYDTVGTTKLATQLKLDTDIKFYCWQILIWLLDIFMVFLWNIVKCHI